MTEILKKQKKFPLIVLEGKPTDIGFQHGRILKKRIKSTINWYKNILHKKDPEIFSLATHFRSEILEFNPNYCDEIEALAAGAEVDPLWIYALNSRSEIMSTFKNECTTVFFRNSALLGQNWDWAQELEKLAIIFKIKPENKPQILMMSEPGIIGKIGFNSKGLGVCLNFLDSGKICKGVPIHIILRGILESPTINKAAELILPFKEGKSANILIADGHGDYIDFEFANKHVFQPKDGGNVFIHTNHYLENEELNRGTDLASSFTRYERAIQMASIIKKSSLSEMQEILLDQTTNELPICRPYVPDLDLGNVGTVCSIIMNLINLKMHITRGSPLTTDFTTINID
ncbi:MAG: C45 family autoproteolytic acyltransferase/hydrolase [Promethearchaeota archaeon]